MDDQEAAQLTQHPMPFVRMELALLTVLDGRLQVLLGRRTGAPDAGRWALPGGVLRIDLDADLDAAAQRVANERLGISLPVITQLCAVGSQHRDPRAPWALSVVYRAMLAAEQVSASPGKRIDALRWTPVDEAMADVGLALDHAHLIQNAVTVTRQEFGALRFPVGFFPEQFTLTDLQLASEAVLGRKLDKSSFRRRLNDAAVAVEVAGAMRTGAFRPAQLYQLAPNKND